MMKIVSAAASDADVEQNREAGDMLAIGSRGKV